MLITFSGLDGAGKSTLVDWLRTALEQRDRRVAVFHMNDHVGVYAYARFARDALLRLARVSKGGRRLQEHDRSMNSKSAWPRSNGKRRDVTLARRIRNAVLWNRTLRRLIYPVDLLVFLCYRIYVEKVKGQILIMDRYFYDSLVDVAGEGGWGWLRLLERITPTPTVPIFLDITPEHSFARKGEYSVDYLRRRWVTYQRIFPWVRSAVALPTNDDLNVTKRMLQQVVMQRIGEQ
jgi:thymidylate kinase